MKEGPVLTIIVGSLKSPATRTSNIASGASDDCVGGNKLSSAVVVGPSGCCADTVRTADIDSSWVVIEQLVNVLINIKVAGGNTIQDSVASIGDELESAIEVDGIGSCGA